MSHFVAKMLPIKSCIWVVLWLSCACCGLECTLIELCMGSVIGVVVQSAVSCLYVIVNMLQKTLATSFLQAVLWSAYMYLLI